MHSESYQTMSYHSIDVNAHLKHIIFSRIMSAKTGPGPNSEALTVKVNMNKNFSKCDFRVDLHRNQIGCVAVADVSLLQECCNFKGFSQILI